MARRLRKRKKKACCRRSYPKCRRIRSERGLPRFVYRGRGGSLNRLGRLGSIAAAIVPHGTRKDHFLPQLFLLRIYHRSHLRSVLFRCDAPVLEHQRILGDTLLLFFIQLRVVLVFFFLVPALALHWMARKR